MNRFSMPIKAANYRDELPADMDSLDGKEDKNDELLNEVHWLQERHLIVRVMLKIIGLTTVIGILALLVPYIYAIVPVYETNQCTKYYGLPFL